MINLDVHNVVSARIEETREFDSFATRQIVLIDQNGQEFRINAFGADKDALKVEAQGAVNLKL